ncbi:MAG TPA: hypothetical protein VF510_11240 [Ktedonobacterales bacterium]
MRSQPRVWLVLIGVIILAASLAACNSSTIKTSKTPLPTPTTGPIQLTVDRAVYTSTQPIGVTITNTTKTDFYSMSGRSGCTFLQLQQYNQKQNTWVSVDPCDSIDQPSVRKIPASVAVPFTLAPGTIPAISPNIWPTGIYRVALQYSPQSDAISSLQIAYSQGFQIKA